MVSKEHGELTKKELGLFIVALIGFGTFCGAGIAYSIAPKQKIIKETTKVVQTVDNTQNTKSANDNQKDTSCLRGKEGVVVNGHSEHVSNGDDKGNWYYGNVITLAVDGSNVVCTWDSAYDMTGNLKIGMKVRLEGGERQ